MTHDRSTYIGASEVAAVLGLSPWNTPTDIYWRKVAPCEEPDSAAMATGRRLEAAIVGWCAETLDAQIARPIQTIVAPDAPMAATPDGMISAAGGVVELVEAKYSSWPEGWGEPYTDQVPDHYLVQALAQLAVCGLAGIRATRVWMPVLLVSGHRPDWRMYVVERHDEACQYIVESCVQFWARHVAPRVPPDPSAPPPESVLRALRREPGSSIALPAEAVAVVDDYERARAAVQAAEDACAHARARVLALLGGVDAPVEHGILPDGRAITYRAQRSPPRVDYARLKSQYPQAWETCVSQGEHRVLRITRSSSGRPTQSEPTPSPGDTP